MLGQFTNFFDNAPTSYSMWTIKIEKITPITNENTKTKPAACNKLYRFMYLFLYTSYIVILDYLKDAFRPGEAKTIVPYVAHREQHLSLCIETALSSPLGRTITHYVINFVTMTKYIYGNRHSSPAWEGHTVKQSYKSISGIIIMYRILSQTVCQ